MSAPEYLRDGGAGRSRTVIATVGYVAVALAVLTAFVPMVGDAVAGTVGVVVGSPPLVVLLGLVGGAYGLLQLYRTGREEEERTPLVDRNPERAHYREERVVGADVDASIEAVDGELPESDAKDWWTYREKTDVKTAMTSVAVDVLSSEHDVSREAAAKMVDDGSWTDDDRAATFLGGEYAGSVPLRTQFFDWLSGAAYERRAEATIDEVAAHAGLRRDGASDGDGADVPDEVVASVVANDTSTSSSGASSTSSDRSSADLTVDDTDFDVGVGDDGGEWTGGDDE